MTKFALTSAVVAALFIAGCSSKSPEASSTTGSQDQGLSGSDKMALILQQAQNQVQNVYFDFDKFDIRADMQGVVAGNASALSGSETGAIKILIEGNCDEWGSDEYNYALGLKRAKASKDALVAKGISEDRIQIASNGESKPVCTDKSKACDAQNRRDEFKLSF